MKFASNPDLNLIIEPVVVAQVLSSPSVEANYDIIYMSATNQLRINGTGFVGAKKVDFYFQPPLVKGVGYEDVSQFPLTNSEIVLRLRADYKWREDPGPLYIIGVDTGGGPARVGGGDGVQVKKMKRTLTVNIAIYI